MGREVVCAAGGMRNADTLRMNNGDIMIYRIEPNYRPIHRVRLWLEQPEEPLQAVNDSLDVLLHIYNPYPFDLQSGEESYDINLNEYVGMAEVTITITKDGMYNVNAVGL